MGRKKKKSIEKTARKGIKKQLSLQLADQLQNVFTRFGDESKKSTKAIAQASKNLAKKLTPMAKIDKHVIKKTMQNAYSQDLQNESVSAPAVSRNATARNTEPLDSRPRSSAPTRPRISAPPAKGVSALKTPARKRERSQLPAVPVSQNFNEDQRDPAGQPTRDQS